MEVILIGYRKWALNTFRAFNKPIIKSMKELNIFLESNKKKSNLCLIFVGWSDIINPEIINNHICICFHPSDLPKYRGGTPIQHQKIAGIKDTKLTAFRMNDGIDSGPIILKTNLSLKGHMNDIFSALTKASIELIEKIIVKNDISFFEGKPQEEETATIYKRRKPEESEITLDELKNLSSEN